MTCFTYRNTICQLLSNHANQIEISDYDLSEIEISDYDLSQIEISEHKFSACKEISNTFPYNCNSDIILRQKITLKPGGGTMVRCPRKDCNHQWTTYSESRHYVSCPYCHGSVHMIRDRISV
jgi:hypothetical protein